MAEKFKIIVLDIDGTLTNSKKELSKRNKELLISMQQRGIKIALASGRPTHGIMAVAEELKIKKYGGYILSFNGGMIVDAATDAPIYSNQLPVELIEPLYKSVKSHGLEIVSYKGDAVITENPEDKYVEIEARLNKMRAVKTNDFVKSFDSPVPKCLAVGDSDKIAILERDIAPIYSDRMSIYRSEPFFLELVPLNIDKAFSLSILLKHLNLTKQEMIAFGDGYNDLSMIEYAGCGVAMANGQQVVKDAANFITETNDNDGVALFIEENIEKFH